MTRNFSSTTAPPLQQSFGRRSLRTPRSWASMGFHGLPPVRYARQPVRYSRQPAEAAGSALKQPGPLLRPAPLTRECPLPLFRWIYQFYNLAYTSLPIVGMPDSRRPRRLLNSCLLCLPSLPAFVACVRCLRSLPALALAGWLPLRVLRERLSNELLTAFLFLGCCGTRRAYSVCCFRPGVQRGAAGASLGHPLCAGHAEPAVQ